MLFVLLFSFKTCKSSLRLQGTVLICNLCYIPTAGLFHHLQTCFFCHLLWTVATYRHTWLMTLEVVRRWQSQVYCISRFGLQHEGWFENGVIKKYAQNYSWFLNNYIIKHMFTVAIFLQYLKCVLFRRLKNIINWNWKMRRLRCWKPSIFYS